MKNTSKLTYVNLMETYPSDGIEGFSLQYNHLVTSEPIYPIDVAKALNKKELAHLQSIGITLVHMASLIMENTSPIEVHINQKEANDYRRNKLLNDYPLLQIVLDTRFTMHEKMWFKSEVIAHGGFVGNGRKDIQSCADYGHFAQVY